MLIRSLSSLLFVLAMLGTGVFAHASIATGDAGVLSFQAWKTSRIDEARANLERIQAETQNPGTNDKTVANKKPLEASASRQSKNVRNDQRLQQAQLNQEIAQELGVSDYFVLYLSQMKNRESLIEAAKKLTPEETADLMISYQKMLAGADQQDTPSTLSGLNTLSNGTLGTSPGRGSPTTP
jgi:hypothetical protein